jgi:hypothetical protein
VLTLALSPDAWAAPPPRAAPEEIARWVKELGDNDFATREKAARKLWAAGEAAEPALRQAANSEDPEVKRRAGDILEKFKWGVYPDTPKDVLNLILNYQAANTPADKINLIGQLLKAGPFGRKALARIAAAEPDEDVRGQVFERITRELPELVAQGDLEAVQPLVEAGLHSGAVGPSYYAAFWLLRGKLDDRIAFFEGLAHDKDEERQKKTNEVLVFLYRAKGDLAGARRAAERAKSPELVEATLYEAADWKALARLPELSHANRDVEKWGYRAAYHRLAGNAKGMGDALAEVRKIAEKDPDKETMSFVAAKIFFLNDRPDEGLELLAQSDRPDLRFEILVAQLKYGEALAMVEAARKAESKHLAALQRLQARTLYFLGEKDRAKKIFAEQAAAIGPGVDTDKFEDLIDAEVRVGLRDLASEHCARLLALVKPEEEPAKVRNLLAKLFPDDTDDAVVLWSLLRRAQPDAAPAQAMAKVRRLLQGKLPAAEVKELLAKAEQGAGVAPSEVLHVPVALANAAHSAGLEELARATLLRADTQKALLRLGDLLAEKKEWAAAEKRYRQAWDKEHSNPLPLYLAGWALVEGGKVEEGKKLQEQAHWLPLADETVRDTFLHQLARRGHNAGLLREADLQRHVSRPESFYFGAALRYLALDGMAHKRYRQAADYQELSTLRCLSPGINFVQAGAYVGVPALIHRLRAHALLAAGKPEDAFKEVALAQAGLPGNLDAAIQLVPELEKQGLAKQADRVFAQTLAVYEKACKEYPRCDWLHNSAAWLSACCRRNLDGALEHAKKAVELAPDSPGHLDTLAEVYFQRGDKARAVQLQKKVIEMDPKKPYYRKQLRRLEAGDPRADRPVEDDD